MEIHINNEIITISTSKVKPEEIEYLVKLYSAIRHHRDKMYCCYYTPRKRLKQADYKHPLLYFASTQELAYDKLIEELNENHVPYKQKYVHDFHELSLKEIIETPTIRSRLIDKEDFNELVTALNMINDKFDLVEVIKGKDKDKDDN